MPRTQPTPPTRHAPSRNALGHLLAAEELHAAGFQGAIRNDQATCRQFSTDESVFALTPQLVLTPTGERDVEIAVQTVAKLRPRFPSLSLTPRAAGTGLSGGALTDSIVLNMCEGLAKIHQPHKSRGALTITCGPGAMWRDVEATLDAQGYYLPSAPASKDICTVGGAVGNNAAGPDSFRHGHTASHVTALRVVLRDGRTYTVRPLTYAQLQHLIKQEHALARIAREVFEMVCAHETAIDHAAPKDVKSNAGYPLWDVLNVPVAEFTRGVGTFNLTRLFAGSQGTLGIITEITLRATKKPLRTSLIVVPVHTLRDLGKAIHTASNANPLNIELFDGMTLELALKNPRFFRRSLQGATFYKALLSLYTTYHVRYRARTPAFTILVTLDNALARQERQQRIIENMKQTVTPAARIVTNPYEEIMLWQIRRASYTLSKLQHPQKRPAAFLEDMTVPPKRIPAYLRDIQRLLKKFNINAAMHGHGGDAHFHFYPLLDFTQKTTPKLITKMADEFFKVAAKHEGSICGEHNDGIMRTPYLHTMFSNTTLEMFAQLEHIFDPHDIFNPGKKVNPRFTIQEHIRTSN